MAAVSGTLQVCFISEYVGVHRVCWRIGGSGPYDCTTLVTCTGNGASCCADIVISVDNETCPVVDFEGYVQAGCEDVSSPNGRIPFQAFWTPQPGCLKYDVTCLNAGVAGIAVTNPGSGYTSAPTVVVAGGGGSGAAAHAVIGTGKVINSSLTFVPTGTGYTNGSYIKVPLLGGTGSGAEADLTIVGGTITVAVIDGSGSGYINGDILHPDPGVVGTPSVTAYLTVVSDYRTITSIVVDTAGINYTSAPTITFTGGAGINGAAIATLAFCPDFTGTDCNGNTPTVDANQGWAVGQTIEMCSRSGPPAPGSQYSVSPSSGINNCLCDCVNITVTCTGAAGQYFDFAWTDCNGTYHNNTPVAVGTPLTICVVAGSYQVLYKTAGATSVIVVNGSC